MIRNKKDISVIIVSILITGLDLFFLYFVKYHNQHLSLSNFNLYNIGNIINLIFAFVLFLGLVIGLFNEQLEGKTKFILIVIIVENIFLLFAALISNIKVAKIDYYIFNEPIEKIVDGILYLFFQLSQFLLITYVWLNVIHRKKYVLLESYLNAIVLFLIIFGFAFLFEEFTPIKSSLSLTKDNDGIAVVLGAAVWPNNQPSPSLKRRIDKAWQLYEEGIVKKIQLTGGNAPGELSEAEVGYIYLQEKGVNPKDVMLEEQTSSTTEQVTFIKTNLIESGRSNIIIVSDAYHLPRVKEICKFNNINVRLVPSGLDVYNEIDMKIREFVGLTFFWLFAV